MTKAEFISNYIVPEFKKDIAANKDETFLFIFYYYDSFRNFKSGIEEFIWGL